MKRHALVTLLIVTLLYVPQHLAAESIKIELTEDSVRDPLLLYRFPKRQAPEKIRFEPNGMLISQPATSKTRESEEVIGVKMMTSSRGDFTFKLDLDCRKMTQPKSGWGHGLIVRLFFADKQKPLVGLGCVSTPDFKKAFWATVEEKDKDTVYITEQCNFKDGSLQVSRVGNELIFSAEESGETVEIHRVEHSTAELLEIQVWANRLPKDNGDASFLLRRISLSADEFFARSEIATSGFGAWTPFFIMLGTTAILLGVYVLRRRQSDL